MAHVVQHQGALHRLMDALALLDLLAGFAKFVARSPGMYSRPGLSETGMCELFLLLYLCVAFVTIAIV